MRAAHLKRIFGVLAVLLLSYGAVRWLSRGSSAPDDFRIPAVVAGGVELVRVLGPEDGDSLRLESAGGLWTVNGYPADTAQIGRLLSGLDSARVGRLVARSASNHERLGVTEGLARRVEIGPAVEPTLTFLLGKAGADGRFVRFPPSEEVYAVPASSVRLLTRTAEDWRSRVVAEADTGALIRIVVHRDDQPAPATLVRSPGPAGGDAGWSLDGATVGSGVVASLLEEAGQLVATGFPTDSIAFAVDFSQPVARLELYESDGPGAAPSLSLLFLTAPDAPEFLVRRADDPLAYRISAAQAERLLPTRELLLGGE